MNKNNIKTLKTIRDAIEQIGSTNKIADLLSAAQEQYDSMSEKAQEGEKGEALQEEINNFETLHSALELLDEAFGNFSFDD